MRNHKLAYQTRPSATIPNPMRCFYSLSSLLLILILTPFESTAGAASSSDKRTLVDRLEASVNSSIILNSDIKKFRETVKLRSQIDPLFVGTSLANQGSQAKDSEIIEFLMNEKMIQSEYPKADSTIEQEISSIQSRNGISREKLIRELLGEQYRFEDYFELIRAAASKRDLIEQEIRTKVLVSPEDVKNHFYNKVSKNTPETNRIYRLGIISISPKNFKSTQAAFQVAKEAFENIKSGEKFEDVAKRVSDDQTASQGGDLGELTSDQMSPLFWEQIKLLNIGKVSSIFSAGKADAPYIILKLKDIRSNDTERFEKLKGQIQNELIAAEYQHQISLWVDRKREKAFKHHAGQTLLKELGSN